MQRGPKAKARTCVCFLSRQISWWCVGRDGGGVWASLAFSLLGDFCLYGQRTLQCLISPQQLNTQALIVQDPEWQVSKLITGEFRTHLMSQSIHSLLNLLILSTGKASVLGAFGVTSL